MHLKFRGVNDAFVGLVRGIHSGEIQTECSFSRVGDVLRVLEPVMISYTNPVERVLFNQARDANYAFLLYESLWMLAGRDDVKPLSYYTSKIAGMASDDGLSFNGAYGNRWRHHYSSTGDLYDEVDQIEVLVSHLKKNPQSRRAVLQMWTVYDDLLKADITKDTCCNLSVVFSVRNSRLNMTVYNRSNDLILGMLGANVCHFSFLLEYMAAQLNLEMGVYNQISCDLHVYTARWEPEKWLAAETATLNQGLGYAPGKDWRPFPLVRHPEVFDRELPEFVEAHAGPGIVHKVWREPFFQQVAQPLLNAFHAHKLRHVLSAADWAARIAADDWRLAMQSWLGRRRKKVEVNQSTAEE